MKKYKIFSKSELQYTNYKVECTYLLGNRFVTSAK